MSPARAPRPAGRWRYALARSDRSPLFYEVFGEDLESPDRLPVVLVDGIGCDGYIWRYLRPELTADGDRLVVHPHYRGHGKSPMPPDLDHVSIPDLADDLAAILDDAGVERAVLVGHSMGVQVSLETYRRHRDRVAGLVLVCGAPANPLKTFTAISSVEELLPRLQGWGAKMPGLVNWVSRAVLPTRLSFEIAARLEIRRELVDPRDFMPYLVGISRVDTRLFLAMLRGAGHHSAEDLLPAIDVPTLVVAAGRDGFTPPARSHEMAERIPGAELVEVPEGSHTAPIERPDLVGDAVADYLARRIDCELSAS